MYPAADTEKLNLPTTSVPAKYLEMFTNGRPDPDVLKIYRITVVVGDVTILAEFAKKAVELAPVQMPERRRTHRSPWSLVMR